MPGLRAVPLRGGTVRAAASASETPALPPSLRWPGALVINTTAGQPRRIAACPLYAAEAVPDSGGDCLCPAERPVCHEGGRPWCTRNDGLRDLHYFGMSCENCECHAETSGSGGQTGDAEAYKCLAEGADASVRPSVLGICTCPDSKPLCVTRSDLKETLGCPLASGALATNPRHFAANCEHCACREVCPVGALHTFADSLGDCACAPDAPVCYQDGVRGCVTNSLDDHRSTSYFRASCDPDSCLCTTASGACEPASCFTTADCGFDTCLDCDMCEGISRCPGGSGAVSELPDDAGNCHCPGSSNCFQSSDAVPGCPTAPGGIPSTVSFRAGCRACSCREATASATRTLSCPDFARDPAPNRRGDCQCPSDAPECYQGGVRWCRISDQRRELQYFSVRCEDCVCRPSATVVDRALQVPCPSFAAAPLSNSQKNCMCPPAKPLCVDTGADSSSTPEGRLGPLCPTTHMWTSSNLFRFDCATCQCEEVEGEGSRFKRIGQEELFDVDGQAYVMRYIVADLRLVGDLAGRWSEVERIVIETAEPAWVAGIISGVEDARTAGVIAQVIELQAKREYLDPRLEPVFALRVRVDFGIMWRVESDRRLAAARGDNGTLVMVRRLTDDGSPTTPLPRLQDVELLTARETMLLQNLPAIFNGRSFKHTLDYRLQRHLNESWATTVTGDAGGSAGRRVTASDAGTGAGSTLEEGTLEEEVLAPRVATTRVTVDMDEFETLSWVGPLEDEPPQRKIIDEDVVVVEEEFEMPWLTLGIALAGAVGLCALCCCAWLLRRWYKRRLARRKSADGSPRSGSSSRTLGGRFEDAEEEMERKGKVDWKSVKTLGDLAGHKSLSDQARQALEAEQREREEELKKRKKRSRGAKKGRQTVSDDESPYSSRDDSSRRDTDSPRSPLDGSPRSPGGSPRDGSPRDGSPRDGSPRDASPRDGESPRSPRESSPSTPQ